MPARLAGPHPRLLIAILATVAVVFGLAPAIGLAPKPAAAATCPCSIWSASTVPGEPVDVDTAAIEVGTKFRSDVSGEVTGIRFYKGEGNNGSHVGHLWTRTGTLLATVTFTGETATGWQQANLSTPVAITANTTYIVSYYAPVGRYAGDDGYFASTGVDNAPLHALRDGVDGANGVYRYGTGGGFPTSTWQSENYWVDVVFTTSAPDTIPPAVTSRTPGPGATNVPTTTTVAASFDEAIQPATAAFELRGPGTTLVPSTTVYNAGTNTLTLTPNAALATGTLYTVNLSGARDTAGNPMTAVSWTFTTATGGGGSGCPCTIWPATAAPAVANAADSSAVELGVKFRASASGFITGLRFYKGSSNTGTHVGHLWSRTGTLLSTATFTGESASGWQQVTLPSPVAVTAGTTYVASYHTGVGFYSANTNFFASAVTRGPLTALANGTDGPNGVYVYGGSAFPTNTYQSSNYWVDVVFDTAAADTTPPTLTARSPSPGASGVPTNTTVTATFNEPVQAGTIDFQLTGPGGAVPASTSYNASSLTATLTPSAALATSTGYTASIGGARDVAGNPMAPASWTFTTAAPAPPGPEQGPGGPVLVLRAASAPFSAYTAEILRAEGFNEFASADISTVTATTLSSYDVVLLGAIPLSAAQVSMLTTWVNGGGNLIGFRPDKQLAGLFGLTSTTGTLANAYLRVDTASAPGAGITGQTIQFHDTADRYNLNGARAVATLYSNATAATSNPAVSLVNVGGNGGQAAAFSYDLPRSIVYTRQGNPAWAGQERDGRAPIRSDDLYFGGSSANWVDLNKVAIPQADEQQRLLGNLIELMNADRKPLPRFWYFPRSTKAVMVATGDDHALGGTAGRFDTYLANSPPGCVVANWECPRFTSYIYPGTPLSNSEAAAYVAAGFEVGLHPENGCQNFTPSNLNTVYATQLSQWRAKYTSLPSPKTNRFHCIVYSDWASQPVTELQHGIRLDTNYYYWPGSWVQNRPGFMTGSGIPMRFANTNGSFVDGYQAMTQMTDESEQSYPFTPNTLLDNALGPLGYYGAFTANLHTDNPSTFEDDQFLDSALSRGVPVITSKQLLDWTDGKNGSSFGGISWNATAGTLGFTVSVGAGANGITGMLPTAAPGGRVLSGLTVGGSPVSFTRTTIKGVEYAMWQAPSGAHTATYTVPPGGSALTQFRVVPAMLLYDADASAAAAPADTTAPAVSAAVAVSLPDGTADVTWRTSEPADSRVQFGTSPAALSAERRASGNVAGHSVVLTGLRSDTTYWYRIVSRDAAGNTTTWPATKDAPARFVTAAAGVADRGEIQFRRGQGGGTQVRTGGYGSLGLRGTRKSGAYVSRILDAGAMVTWDRAAWQADLPAGARLRISVRIGSTRTPDRTWSGWQVLSGQGARVVGDSRYLQYRVELTAPTAARTPALRAIGFTHNGTLPTMTGETGLPGRR